MAKAYMIGTGIGNLAAGIYLIRDGGWSGSQITMFGLETHGANDGAAVADYENEYSNTQLSNDKGFLAKGGRMLNEETYENFWDLLRSVPSLDNPGQSVTDDILNFDHAHPTHDVARLMDKENGIRNNGGKDDYSHMKFNNKDRMLLTKLIMMPESKEEKLNDISIKEWFKDSPHMFTTNFWYMWETTFAFKKESSAMELRRYMNRMILEFSRINTLEGVTRTPYNQYESVILPMRKYLEDQGVTFVNNRKVTAFQFKDTALRDDIVVTGLEYEDVAGEKQSGVISVDENDLVFDTNGSVTDSSSMGDLDTPIKENMEYAPSAKLWKQATEHFYNLGNPDKFFNDRSQSEWLSFTITTNNHYLLNQIRRITQQEPGNALNTWIDSNNLLSIVVHHQPHFHAQKENETVFWGYAMFPRKKGDYVDKAVIDMTGREILQELLGHLAEVDPAADNIRNHEEEIMKSVVNVVPVFMPYASALFNQRALGDRPDVVPKNSKNLAFISQFAEMPFDMVFTEQYSFRAAQIAVYHFMGIPDSELTPVHHYEKDPKVLAKATKTMFR
ncbi:oleate hydratase [Pediococcus claussenii]|uniref:67 kDa myosin-cross-reactive antigen like family protein n=1 Tax=Pediococcus claussenii (strain ATCC BAA-344 / DSM 14800 / JCM 18046 / KCTC 3811 / LMG 21948 / P06) TaxID=701521 RepID=G8PC58_PEDCP|nr:oleate hydratase [Pediococcus claussenii]AEV94877.1 67 kDa myosin-cross-reactive antigen like family protein [Pediococcus claussenii ATCC BAA-344]ANZ70072.1 oleate hydratase [Pediococcus claussenii]ANZ71887.1 oleate hydratase [Pediococcus claussenii]